MIEQLNSEEQFISDRIQNLSFLVADHTSSRRSVRKLLSYFRVKPGQIEVVEDFNTAKDLLESRKPNVVFAEYEIGGGGGMELLQQHQRITPSPGVRVFFLVTQKDSNALASTAAEQDCDAVLVKPLTFQNLEEHFIRVMKQKAQPTEYYRLIDQARAKIDASKFQEALGILETAKSKDAKPTLAYAMAGAVFLKLKQPNKALENFQAGLKLNPTHYKCMTGVMDVLLIRNDNVAAYEIGKEIAKHHPIPLPRLPDFIRLSIVNQRFADTLEFAERVDDASQMDEKVSLHISAGLVVCGIHLFKCGKNAEAVKALRKAEVCCKGNPKVLTRILSAYIGAGLEKETKSLLGRVPEAVKQSNEVRLAELSLLQKQGKPYEVLKHGLELVRQGVREASLYETLITISLELNRRIELVEDLVWRAGKDFPDKKADFERYLPKKEQPVG
jgi:DNA-binding NarL/FixJ family response regulator